MNKSTVYLIGCFVFIVMAISGPSAGWYPALSGAFLLLVFSVADICGSAREGDK